MTKATEDLASISFMPPKNGEAHERWIEQADVVSYLNNSEGADDWIIYASLGCSFLHGVLVPNRLLEPLPVDDLLRWSGNPYMSSWGVSFGFGKGARATLSPPLSSFGSKAISQGEQLVFAREFDGVPERSNYYEIGQRFIHVSNLHWLEERTAWCRLDNEGEIEEIIKIEHPDQPGREHTGTVITCRRNVLEEYMALTDSSLVLMFDFTRFDPRDFPGWDHKMPEQTSSTGHAHLRKRVMAGVASYAKGVHVRRTTLTTEALAQQFSKSIGGEEEREYASFVAWDFKHKKIDEISTAPEATDNYFQETGKPLEMSPAFFNARVLAKYKIDTTKYTVNDRSIACRGAWHLTTYDVNEAGQVHTYIVYLRALPYKEQLYWKSFNEPPKKGLSARAIETDFKGEFAEDATPVEALKRTLNELHTIKAPWWTLKAETIESAVHRPLTGAADEWAEELLKLDKLVVEGLNPKWLRKRATQLGRTPEDRFGGLKLIEECLIGCGFEEEHARALLSPLHDLHNLRSIMKGHAAGSEAAAKRKAIVKEHGGLLQHYDALCQACEETLQIVRRAFEADPASSTS